MVGCTERVATVLRETTHGLDSHFLSRRDAVSPISRRASLAARSTSFILDSISRFSNCSCASNSVFNRSILMRSSLLALEEAVEFLAAPDEFLLIWLAEPCTSVQF